MHTFGIFNESGVADAAVLSQYFDAAYDTPYSHDMGKVRFGYCTPVEASNRQLVRDRHATVIYESYDPNESKMAGFVCHLLVGCKAGCNVATHRR